MLKRNISTGITVPRPSTLLKVSVMPSLDYDAQALPLGDLLGDDEDATVDIQILGGIFATEQDIRPGRVGLQPYQLREAAGTNDIETEILRLGLPLAEYWDALGVWHEKKHHIEKSLIFFHQPLQMAAPDSDSYLLTIDLVPDDDDMSVTSSCSPRLGLQAYDARLAAGTIIVVRERPKHANSEWTATVMARTGQI